MLCRLELRTLFGIAPLGYAFCSNNDIDVSRSPFLRERIAIQYEDKQLSGLAEMVRAMDLNGSTFKVKFVKTNEEVPFELRREVERTVGRNISGQAEMRKPEVVFGVAKLGDRWVFGNYSDNKAVWLQHNRKAQHYSTALSTRIARAIVNIAVPDPTGVTVVDPCCGIGTVVIEALSMGIAIVGYDINWMAVHGARLNLRYFGLPDVVKVADMRSLTGRFDSAIVDLPYNLCSVLPNDERDQLLQSVKRLARKAVIISTEAIDDALKQAGLTILDRCYVKKGTFKREVLVCSRNE